MDRETCPHTACSPSRRLAMLDLGPRRCPSCDAYCDTAPGLRALANVVMVVVFAYCVAASIDERSFWPCVGVPLAFVVTRGLVVRFGRVVEVPRPSGLSWLWFLLLAVIVVAMSIGIEAWIH